LPESSEPSIITLVLDPRSVAGNGSLAEKQEQFTEALSRPVSEDDHKGRNGQMIFCPSIPQEYGER